MSEAPIDAPEDTLVLLFRSELGTHAAVLGGFLQQGEKTRGQPVEADVLRALHSIKGAARILQLPPVVSLAEAIEGCLEAWPDLSTASAGVVFDALVDGHAYFERLARASESPPDFVRASGQQLAGLVAACDSARTLRAPGPTRTAAATAALTAPFAASDAARSQGLTFIDGAPGTFAPDVSATDRLAESSAEAPQAGHAARAGDAPDRLEGPMLELFRSEVDRCASVLGDGLVELDGRGPSPALWEPIMRAAHSIKGAARVVSFNAMAQLAHTLEDCFVAAQHGRIALQSVDIDGLLHAVDMLKSAGDVVGDPRASARAAAAGAMADTTLTLAQMASRALTSGVIAAADTVPAVAAALSATAGGLPASDAAHGAAVLAGPRGQAHPIASRTVAPPASGLTAPPPTASRGAAPPASGPTTPGSATSRGAAPPASTFSAPPPAAARAVMAAASGPVGLTAGESRASTGSAKAFTTPPPADARAAKPAQPGSGQLVVPATVAQATPGAAGSSTSTSLVPPQVKRDPVLVHATPAAPGVLSDPAPARGRDARKGKGKERTLRVAADSIDRVMGLAAESLVESRRVALFARNLQHVRKQHGALVDLLNSLERLLVDADGAARELLVEAKTRARDCAKLVSDHTVDVDNHMQRAEQFGESLYREALKSRMRPFGDGTHGFPRLVRDVSRQLGKRARAEIVGQSTEVDRDVLDALEAPINHLVRNALDHGIESPDERRARGKPEMGAVRIEARHHAGMLLVIVNDDGRGIDLEAIRRKVIERGLVKPALAVNLSRLELFEFLFLPGFSTAQTVSEISGRGVGLDVVRNSVEALGGTVRVVSDPERGGAAFHLQLPVTRSVVRAVVAEIGGEHYAFPLLRIDRIDRVPHSQLRTLENRQFIVIDSQPVALVSAAHVLGVGDGAAAASQLNVIVVSDRTQRFGIVVDELRGEHDLVVRPLDARLGKVQDVAAAAILIDGAPALIVDVDDLVRSVERLMQGGALAKVEAEAGDKPALARKRVLVVDDSIIVREAERQLLVNRGYHVDVAVDGIDGLNSVRKHRYDLLITDVDMPRMNGIELVRSIKQDARLNTLPVVIVSYKDREEDRMAGLEAGANYYLSKSSFHDEKLVEAVEDLIGSEP